jgi:hypothetical protein
MSTEDQLVVRAYRINWWCRAFSMFWTGLVGLFWTVTLWDEFFGEKEPGLWQIIAGTLFVVSGTIWVTHLFRARVTLFADAIETSGLLGRARLRFNEIRGRREYVVRGGEEGGNTPYLKVVSNDDRLPSLDFIKYYNFDDAFYAWFKGLPDLDAADQLRHRISGRVRT